MAESTIGNTRSALERDRRAPSAFRPGCPHHGEVANPDRDRPASIWLLTLALFSCFLGCSLVMALLATHFGWLGSAVAPLSSERGCGGTTPRLD